MTKKTILIDVASAGASGDMFLSALIDLMSDDDALVPLAASLLIFDPTIRVKVLPRESGDQKGRQLEVTVDESVRFTPKSLREMLGAVCEEVETSKAARTLANNILETLFKAESRAHETPIDDLHLHELGTVDTILDIAGTVYLLEKAGYLKDTRFLSTKVAIGSGTVNTEHGEMEIPVPAVAEIIVEHDLPFIAGAVEAETLTPTGAAILVHLAEEYVESTDGFNIEEQGTGFGTRDFGDTPNMLRILVGEPASPPKKEKPAKPPKEKKAKKSEKPAEKTPVKSPTKEESEVLEGLSTDEVVVIETNVDDVDGEIMGELFDTLLEGGLAHDVVLIPAYGKKNRPCYIVKIIAPFDSLTRIAEILITHLGTLGIRYQTWSRLKAAREIVVTKFEVDDQEFMVRVKVSRAIDGSIVAIKPEADDIIKISRATGIPIRELKPRIVFQAHAVTE